MECTDDKTLSKAERKRLQVESCPHKSVKARLVKMADKIYNLRDLNRVKPQGWSDERVHEYFEWAQKVTNGKLSVSVQQLTYSFTLATYRLSWIEHQVRGNT